MKNINNDKLIKNTTVYLREKKFIKMENDGKSRRPYMIENFLKNFVQDQNEPIIHAHVTSPFLRQKTLIDAIQFMNKGYDSVTSCNKIRKIAFLKDKNLSQSILNLKINTKNSKFKSNICIE